MPEQVFQLFGAVWMGLVCAGALFIFLFGEVSPFERLVVFLCAAAASFSSCYWFVGFLT